MAKPLERKNVMLRPDQVELLKEFARLQNWSLSETVRTVIDKEAPQLREAITKLKRRKEIY